MNRQLKIRRWPGARSRMISTLMVERVTAPKFGPDHDGSTSAVDTGGGILVGFDAFRNIGGSQPMTGTPGFTRDPLPPDRRHCHILPAESDLILHEVQSLHGVAKTSADTGAIAGSRRLAPVRRLRITLWFCGRLRVSSTPPAGTPCRGTR